MEISTQLLGETPQLSVGERLCWSVPVVLGFPDRGIIGRVGEIPVDATNGELLIDKEKIYRTLAEVSPAVHTLATKQFDDYVKRVRIFVHPRIAGEMREMPRMDELLRNALIALTESSFVLNKT